MALEVVIGIGVSQAAGAGQAVALAEEVMQAPSVRDAAVIAVATIFGRAEHPAVRAVAAQFGVPVIVFDAARLEEETPRLKNPSAELFARIGCHGVAEAAALASAGPAGSLLIGKTKQGAATVAIARIGSPG